MGEKLYHRVVAKFGTNLLTAGSDRLDLRAVSALVVQAAALRRAGVDVIVVTSGAIAAGRHQLMRPLDAGQVLSRQVYAAIGQGALMRAYADLFAWHDVVVAQALLTRRDLADRSSYLNSRATLNSLLDVGVVPIVNENDVVAVEEIEEAVIGDNDTLSALVANVVEADLLVILTDSGGLFAEDPRLNPDARLIERVDNVDEIADLVSERSASAGGTGGMATKVAAARLATAGGTHVVIAGGHEPGVLLEASHGRSAGTFFPAAVTRLEGRRRFLLSGLSSKGQLVVDAGAADALQKGGRSLLPAGVKDVRGPFQRGDAVTIVNGDGRRLGYGIVNYDDRETVAIRGKKSTEIAAALGHDYGAEIIHRNNMVLLD
jgi:glutamate 5-kinase